MADREKVIKGLEETEIMLTRAVDRGGEMAVMGAFKCLNRVTDALALLKEDCHNCKLECLLQKYDELKEKYDSLLKEQEKQRFFVDEDGKITPLPVVVRCKDCKRGVKSPTFQYYPNLTWCNKHSQSHNDDWFCADGERKPTQTNAKNDALDVR